MITTEPFGFCRISHWMFLHRCPPSVRRLSGAPLIPSASHTLLEIANSYALLPVSCAFVVDVVINVSSTGKAATHLNVGVKVPKDIVDLILESTGEHFIGLVQDEHLDAFGT